LTLQKGYRRLSGRYESLLDAGGVDTSQSGNLK